MSRPTLGTDRTPVVLSARPASRGWVLLCLALGASALAVGWGAALAERGRASAAPLAESLLTDRVGSQGAK